MSFEPTPETEESTYGVGGAIVGVSISCGTMVGVSIVGVVG